MSQQTDMFEPRRKPELSQWFTPPRVARQLATWVPRSANVLEPACGGGALIDALLRQNHPGHRITAVELDEEWANYCDARFDGRGVGIYRANFLSWPKQTDMFDVCLMNPPFENGQAVEFVDEALRRAFVVVGIFPVTVQFGEERDRTFWSKRARVTRRAILPERVDYGGDWGAKFETVALKIVARDAPRIPGEILQISEEVWRKEDCA